MKMAMITVSVVLSAMVIPVAPGHCVSGDPVVKYGASAPAGFESLSHDGDTVYGVFSTGGRTLTVELVRGNEVSGVIRQMDPTAPPYEIDLRVVTEDGRVFFAQYGGHGPTRPAWGEYGEADAADQTWGEYGEPTLGSVRPTDDVDDLDATAQMLKSLASTEFVPELEPEHQAILDALGLVNSIPVFEADDSSKDYNDRHRIRVYKKPVTWLPANVTGEHSGTVAHAISASGSTYQIWSACNHGTCPGNSSMSLSCTGTFYNRPGFCAAPPMCTTPMQWDQSDWWNDDYRHVCNDDSRIQVLRIRNNTMPSQSSGTCRDTSLNRWAPSCN